MIGKTISHYRVIGKLSGGGMGVVCRAEETRLVLGAGACSRFGSRQLAGGMDFGHSDVLFRERRSAAGSWR